MLKRKWQGDPLCYFCHLPEIVTQLFFTCSIAKIVWATIATCLGATDIPTSFNQSWKWCETWIPNGKQFHVVGIAAICWSVWKMRNKICFEGKKLHNPLEIVSHACALMKHWAGLQKDVDKEVLIQGVNAMFKIAVQILAERRNEAQANMLPEAAREDEADQESER
jgi:hypothetical protein